MWHKHSIHYVTEVWAEAENLVNVPLITKCNEEIRKWKIILKRYREFWPLLQNVIAHQLQGNWCLCPATANSAFTLHQCGWAIQHTSPGSPTAICWDLTRTIHKSSSSHQWNTGLHPGSKPAAPCREWHRNTWGSHCAPSEVWVVLNICLLTTLEHTV